MRNPGKTSHPLEMHESHSMIWLYPLGLSLRGHGATETLIDCLIRPANIVFFFYNNYYPGAGLVTPGGPSDYVKAAVEDETEMDFHACGQDSIFARVNAGCRETLVENA